ncbi:MAG TPA: NADH-ubiquinone oxidoreductase-F iron-sulfur binding region domain-containing protein [Gaiellaceae bacterium]|nr:NADH-ubiquinone oxidoreductase-F iron-sulfur binding region domain-containing protein [Gaiellaceae bacterium]
MTAPAVEATRAAPLLLTGIRNRALTLDEHMNTFGELVRHRDLIQAIARAGLRGRGGAAFPTAEKLKAVVGQRMTPTVVVNAVEGEPASSKDRALMRLTPHLVLDGAALAADAVGADRVVVALSESARPERHALAQAIRERRGAFEIATVPARFVAGEETALLQAIEGGPAKPTLKPPYPFERGYLVQNAETLAQVAIVARHGRTTGTALVTLSGAVNRPGVHEIELGGTLADVVHSLGGTSEPVSAFLVAGYFGCWVAARDAATMTLTPDNLGAGVIVALPTRASGIGETARIARYLAGESAGQCGPCVHGLDAIAGALESLARGDRAAASRLTRWTAHVRGRGACRHPDGAARLVESALAVFA